MRRQYISLFLLALSCCAIRGQEFKILEVKESQTDSLLSKPLPVDLNEMISAVVVLSFTEQIHGLTFRGNIIKRDSISDSVYALYVSHGTKRITLQHENFYPFVLDFQEKGIKIIGGHAYHAKIDNKTSENTNDITNNGKQEKVEVSHLTFKSDLPIKDLIVNDNVWLVENGVFSKNVPCGTYHYRAVSADGKIAEGQVEVSNKSFLGKTVKIIFL